MKKKIYKAIAHPLISGSALLFLGSAFTNFFNFAFNLYMSRALSVSDYGILASLISLILLFALISDSLIPTVVHSASSYFAKDEIDNVKGLFWKLSKYFFLIGFVVVLIFFLLRSSISDFFKIGNKELVVFVGFTVFFGFIGAINRGLLQAKLEFKFISIIGIISSSLKLLTGILLILLGLKTKGAILAFVLYFSVAYLLTFIPLRFLFKGTTKRLNIKIGKILSYGGSSVLALLGLTSFITSDVILVKHFFTPNEAGIYAGMSLLGRIIYFFSGPITMVMFPLIVQRHVRNEKYRHLFKLSIALIFIASSLITVLYFLLPDLIIKLFLKNEEYLMMKPFLGFFGIYFTLYSMLSIFVNFYLSIRETKIFIPIIIGSLIQILLILMFHNTFLDIIIISICIMVVLLITLSSYYFLYGKISKKQ